MFENVTYTFYSETLGRSIIPDEATFNRYVLENKLYVKRLYGDGLIFEREEYGIDSAVCMMIEVDYQAEKIATGEAAPDSSESINGYSHSISTKAYDTHIEKNTQSVAAQKYKWLGLFCDITNGGC